MGRQVDRSAHRHTLSVKYRYTLTPMYIIRHVCIIRMRDKLAGRHLGLNIDLPLILNKHTWLNIY